MVWNLGNPDLSLQCDLVHVLLELPKIWEQVHIQSGDNAIVQGDFQFLNPLGSHGAVRRDGLNYAQLISLVFVEHHIRQLVMLGEQIALVGLRGLGLSLGGSH